MTEDVVGKLMKSLDGESMSDLGKCSTVYQVEILLVEKWII